VSSYHDTQINNGEAKKRDEKEGKDSKETIFAHSLSPLLFKVYSTFVPIANNKKKRKQFRRKKKTKKKITLKIQ